MINFPKIIVETLTGAGGGITNLVKKGESGFRPDVPPPQPPDNPSGYMFEFSTHNDNNSELPITLALMPKDNNWTVVDADTGELLVNAQGAVSPEGILVTRVSPGEATPYESFMIVFSRSGGGHRKYKVSGKHYQMGIGLLEEFNPGVLISKGSVIVHRYLDTNNKYFFAIKDANLTVPLTLPRHITDLGGMFAGSNQFNQDLSRWDTSQVTTMNDMFSECTAFNQDISKWDVSNVTNMNHMFSAARAFNQDLSPWCVKKIPNKPTSFDSGALRWSKPRPQWGTCPGEEVVPPYVPPVVEEVDDNTVIKAFDFAVIRYIWTPTGGEDLDTRTYLTVPERTGRKVGWKRLKNDDGYLIWNEDNTGVGVESVLIDIDKIHTDYPNEQVIVAQMDGFWYANIKSGKFRIEFATFKGGKMVASGYDWVNQGGRAIQILKLGVDTLIHKSDDIDGEHLATLSYDTLLKQGTLVAREGPSSGNGDPEVPVIPSEGGGNGPGGIVDPTNPVYPDSEQGFTFSVKILDNDGGSVPFDIRLVKVAPGWKVYSGNTLILSADKIHPQVSAKIAMGDVTLTFNIPRKDIKTYTIIADASSLAFEVTQTSFSGQDIVINRFSSTISNHQFSVTDAILRVPTVLPSYITSTFNMFLGANQFNQDISGWDTSNVTNMSGMFDNAETFNQDISGWDVSNVTNMMFMFRYAHKFNQPIGSWNVKNVTNMKSMFESAPAFNQDLSKWCVRKIATKPDRFDYSAHALYTSHLPVWGTCPRGEDGPTFYYTRFVTDNPNSGDGSELGIHIDLKGTGGLWQAIDTLTGELLANQDGGKVDGVIVGRYGQYNESTTVRFNRTGVSTKQHISLGIEYSSNSIRIRGPSVEEGVYYPPGRVFEITEFSPKIWNYQLFMRENAVKVPSVLPVTLKNCEWLFTDCYNIVTDLSGWDTSHVYNTAVMFVNCKSFNQDISGWDVSNVAYMRDMFSGCTNFNQDLSPWSVVKQPSKPSGFDSNCSNWTKPKPIWGTSGGPGGIVDPTNPVFPNSAEGFTFTVETVEGYEADTGFSIVMTDLENGWEIYSGRLKIMDSSTSDPRITKSTLIDTTTFSFKIGRSNIKTFTIVARASDLRFSPSTGPQGQTFTINRFGEYIERHRFSVLGCPLVIATDLPTYVTSTNNMFKNATVFDGDISMWDTSHVTDMSHMFAYCEFFNQDISGWDVSNVVNMSNMFIGARKFNQPIVDWDTARVTDMENMFSSATNFAQDLSGWCVPLVTEEPYGFNLGATGMIAEWMPVWGTCPSTEPTPGGGTLKFSTRSIAVPRNRMKGSITLSGLSGEWQLLGGGTVLHSNVSTANPVNYTVYLTDWFAHEPRFEFIGTASRVDIDLPNGFAGIKPIGEVIIESFSNTVAHQTISAPASILIVPETLPPNITSTNKMFRYCSEFNQDISMWDTSNVTDMSFMFGGASSFNQDIGGWNVGQVTNMNSMFDNAKRFNQDLSSWNVSLIPSEPNSFAYSVIGWTLPKPVWGTDGKPIVTPPVAPTGTPLKYKLTSMVDDTPITISLKTTASDWTIYEDGAVIATAGGVLGTKYTKSITGDTINITRKFREDYVGIFEIYGQLDLVNISHVNVNGTTYCDFNLISFGSDVTNHEFNIQLSTVIVPTTLPGYVTNTRRMFKGCDEFNQNISTWDTVNVTDMSEMFSEAIAFNQPIGTWNVSKVTDMGNMFKGCESFNQPIDSWNTANVTDMSYMFEGCIAFDMPLNTWNVSNVTNMQGMFKGCEAFNGNISSWNVSNVVNMSYMFKGCTSFNTAISNWKPLNVVNMSHMFDGCENFDQLVSQWKTPKATDMSYMFAGCNIYNRAMSAWDVSNVTNMQGMFKECYLFNKTLALWNVSNVSDMSHMFESCDTYNQDLSAWKPSKIKTKPIGFDNGASAWVRPQPTWGYLS